MTPGKTKSKPRLWPSLVVGFGTLVLLAIVSNVTIYLVVNSTLEPGQEFSQEIAEQWANENMATASGFLKVMIPIHLSMLFFGVFATSRSRMAFTHRLGLTSQSIPFNHYIAFMLGTLGVSAIAGWAFLAYISPGEKDMVLAQAFARVGGLDGTVIVLYAATVASFIEEVVLRGFILRGLLRRWKPFFAVALSAILFALIHPSPFFMLAALPLGIWFGILTWKTHSLWPALACHSFANLALAGLNRWYPYDTIAFFGELTFWPILTGIFGVIMLVVSLWMLFRRPSMPVY